MTGEFSLAVHALVFLNHKKTTVSSEMLADNICTNPARVRKVMSMLAHSGLVETKEGRISGGYIFTLDASDVTLKKIAEAVSAVFTSSNRHSGSIDKECLISSGMGEILDNIYSELNNKCYEELEKLTIADIDLIIFK